ncbi:Predicted dehydrogenase [Butyrivibrio sp. Su6]|uniref:Gfo/Idh/MocA family protein n=1 Tax=Butyrivibrio sp. Su6 TaxID=1520810 RepID=UPI00089F79FE|nr:Gfo/Idh/MocA family oxidoreductase [Butyrivibrio sp. Su6]SEG02664.1 Predicted dehydrogenase [Butyrivibrio sp. Su6]
MFGRTRVAIMGTGRIAEIMAKTLKNAKGVTCYAVGSRTEEKAKAFASKYGIKRYYGSYESLVADPKVDLVYVATPHSEHFENVKLALLNGKHVLCEKAFMLNEQQAKTIFDLAEEKDLLVVEAMWVRFMPMRNKLMEVLAGGVIGEPTMLTANLGYNIAHKERIAKPELGGGVLLDLGVYVLNFASMVFGNDVTDIVSMCSFNNLGMDLHDSITLRYRDGKMAVLNASGLSVSDRSGVIYGTKGYIVVDNINNFEGITVYDSDHKKTAYYKRPKQKTGYEYEVEACVRALNEKWIECPEMPHSESLKILNMMDFIRKTNGIVFPIEKNENCLEQMQENETGDVLEAEVVQADVVSTEENNNDTEEIQNETVSVSEENEGVSENAQDENAGAVEE